MNRNRLQMQTALILGALVLATPALALARGTQPTTDPRWDAWVGCWQAEHTIAPAPAQESALGDEQASAPPIVTLGGPVVCVLPTSSPSTVQVVTVTGGKVAARDEIAATGQRRSRTQQGCTGWESATWSSDGERVYLKSEDACPRGLARTSTGVLAMSPAGEWVDAQGVTVGGHTGVRVIRYKSVSAPTALPADLAAELTTQNRSRAVALGTARAAAGAPLTSAAVIDASRHLDPAVAEAWVLASGQHMTLDASQLVALADAGVPGKVTDALVALSYPKAFALNDGAAAAGTGDALSLQTREPANSEYNGIVTGRQIPVFIDPYLFAPYAFDAYGYSPYYGYSNAYGYGYGNPYSYGYSPYGLGYAAPYGGFIAPPVIVLKGSGSPTTVSGRVVNGRGYVPGTPVMGTRTAEPRMPPPPPSGTGEVAPPPPPTQRTAHRRP